MVLNNVRLKNFIFFFPSTLCAGDIDELVLAETPPDPGGCSLVSGPQHGRGVVVEGGNHTADEDIVVESALEICR